MAVFYAKDFSVTVGTVNLSSSINSVELSLESDALEVTTFGSGGWRQRIAGLQTGSLSIDWLQDYGAAAVEATVYPLFQAGTATVVIKPTSGTVSATNPSYTVPVVVSQWTPMAGQVGDVATLKTQWQTAGSVVKATS